MGKTTIKYNTRKKFTLPKYVMPATSRAILAILSLALLLFSFIGVIEGITNARAIAPNLPSTGNSVAKPTKTPPGKYSPTPTAPASPTFTATPTTISIGLPGVTPAISATTLTASQGSSGSQIPTPKSSLSTPSNTSDTQLRSQNQQDSEPPLFSVVMGTLGGIAGLLLLFAVGLLLLRRYSMPVTRAKLASSNSFHWQRVRTDSLHDNMNNSSYSEPAPPTPRGRSFLSSTRNVIPSRRTFTSTISNFTQKRKQSFLPTGHSLKPTRLKALNSSTLAGPESNSSIPIIQNNQLKTTTGEPWKNRDSDEMPSLDDPFLRATLQSYIVKGQLARQSRESEQ